MQNSPSRVGPASTMKRKIVTTAAAGLLLFTSACGTSGESVQANGEASKKMSIAAYPGLFLGLPIYAAQSAGTFTNNGIEPDIVQIAGGPNQAAALSSGDIDTFVFPVNAVLPLREKGQPFKAIVNAQGPAIYTIFGETKAVTDCPTAKDPYPGPLKCLKGQPVGVAQLGGDSFMVLMAMLKDAGLTQSDLNLVAVGASSNLTNAFKAGQIKFAIGVEPAPAMLDSSMGLTTTLVSLAGKDVGETFSPWVGETFWAAEAALKEDPDKFQRFKKAISEAITWLQDPANKDKVVELMQKELNLDEKTARSLADNQLEMFTAQISCPGVEKARAFAISTDALKADNKETCSDITWDGAHDLLVKK